MDYGGVVVALIALGAIVWGVRHLLRDRTAAEERAASVAARAGDLDLRFCGDRLDDLPQKLLPSLFAKEGNDRRITNRLTGTLDGQRADLFDVRVEFLSENGRSEHLRTILFLAVPPGIPHFMVRPEGAWDRLGELLGVQDIDFASHPKFSRRFVLRGPDTAAVRRLFGPLVLEWFERRGARTAEVFEGGLLWGSYGTLILPQELEVFRNEGLDLVKQLTAPR